MKVSLAVCLSSLITRVLCARNPEASSDKLFLGNECRGLDCRLGNDSLASLPRQLDDRLRRWTFDWWRHRRGCRGMDQRDSPNGVLVVLT